MFVIAALAGTATFFSPLLTHYIEGNAFRAAMEDETAKGLHFPRSRYSPIRRTSALTAQSASFEASNGVKAMKSLEAHGITARFDPWGVFVRQWRFNDVHVQSGDVALQIYEANPEAVKPKPWFAFFLPSRVYVQRIESEQANVTWQLRGEKAGFFGTRLLITPHGQDFEYVATGGRVKMALLPDLDLRRAHTMSILHRIRAATKAFTPRQTPASGMIRASISKRTSMRSQFARGCQRNGKGV